MKGQKPWNDPKRREEQEEQIKALTDQLEKGIKEVFTSEKYKAYLSTMEKFHSYSFNNSILIYVQKPNATMVAGFKTWQSLERQVKKGERGIRIFAPRPYKVIRDVEAVDPGTGEVLLDPNGKPIMEKEERSYVRFIPVKVFDVSQTEGKALPTLTEELQGEAQNYEALMAAVKETAQVPIRFASWTESKKGYYNLTNQEIVIKSGMSERQTVKTAIHETAHSILHTDKEHLKDSATMEVEAESVAFVVCQHFGLDTSDYSFGYLAGWSSGKELPELKASLQTIQKTSDGLIGKLEHLMKKYINNLAISQSLTVEAEQLSGIGDTFYKHTHRR
ncbi:MAG: ArdC-like ssDNA-binding domain-containing protein [Lacrimispora saccharolytica]